MSGLLASFLCLLHELGAHIPSEERGFQEIPEVNGYFCIDL